MILRQRGSITAALMCAAVIGTHSAAAGGRSSVKIDSPSFESGGSIPPRFTCEGENLSPALAWSEIPSAAKSLALIVDDPDAPDPAAPKMTWVHWVMYDIPPAVPGLSEGASAHGAANGLNDWKKPAYGGPCPPKGEHRYFFKLYALDTVLKPDHALNKAELERAMNGHVVASAELIGRYRKSKS